jgi:hypothetical protein
MRIHRSRIFAGLATLVVASIAARAQPLASVTIRVTVVSAATHEPVAGAVLRLRTIPETAVLTDSFGRGAFEEVPRRIEGIEASHPEFESRTEVLLLRGDFDDVSITLPLKPRDATRLRTVAVTAEAPTKAHSLEARRAIGRGHLIDRHEIDRVRPRATTDMLRRVPGLRVETAGSGPTSQPSRRRLRDTALPRRRRYVQ